MWKKILKYLKGTKNYEIKRTSGESNIKAYADADYGGDTNNQEINIMFFFFLIMLGNSPTSWHSKLQHYEAHLHSRS